MSRRMSCALTIDAVRARTKTVTRRRADTWGTLQAGAELVLIEKGMGLPKGARQVVLDTVRVIDVRLEPLSALTLAGVAAEGFGPGSTLGGATGWTVRDFTVMWLGSHGYHADRDSPARVLVRRIEWAYTS